ncbi:hypothetical protein RFI_14556 [Reticulomyxa filosa]|uniref:Tetratricopeptide repeat protein 30 n=1 Tax=Reticulomyxa filosa TaxID=46433 RepID=X6NBE0_RETFI|nr:hypothetical protein RFI_14556 [Reticulomyxa filosa]|eukprot:ETO22637.1 hypothetical protein RFI_14556 [Reticulomyxa filosa]
MLKQNDELEKILDEVITRGIREHPELCVGVNHIKRNSSSSISNKETPNMVVKESNDNDELFSPGSSAIGATVATESKEENAPIVSNDNNVHTKSVGNSQTLKDTLLIEVLNLKTAKEFLSRNMEKAELAVHTMPPRDEHELDPVTLHNHALLNIGNDINESFRKLNFLLTQDSFPKETFYNLLETFDFLETTILAQTSPAEAYQRFGLINDQYIERLRQLTKKLNEARINNDTNKIKETVYLYLEALEKYVQVLMSQARVYWEKNNWKMVQKILENSQEFACDHDTYRLNMAHVLFMQQNKFQEAIQFYEPIVHKQAHSSILNVTAMVLANLCVAYIMTSQNRDAEELIKQIEKEEDRVSQINPKKPLYHLCIVNLVIGTLYCSKGNYTFGLGQIVKSLEPLDKRLGADTWYHAKRCFLSYLDILAKQVVVLKDSMFHQILSFLDAVEEHGQLYVYIFFTKAYVLGLENKNTMHFIYFLDRTAATVATNKKDSLQTIAQEARLLKTLYLQMVE